MKPVASATIGGKRTNRVKVASAKVVRKADQSPSRALRRYRKDPSTRGLDYVVTCISLPVGELAVIDEACERAQMARSHFLRQAAKHFIAKVLP